MRSCSPLPTPAPPPKYRIPATWKQERDSAEEEKIVRNCWKSRKSSTLRLGGWPPPTGQPSCRRRQWQLNRRNWRDSWKRRANGDSRHARPRPEFLGMWILLPCAGGGIGIGGGPCRTRRLHWRISFVFFCLQFQFPVRLYDWYSDCISCAFLLHATSQWDEGLFSRIGSNSTNVNPSFVTLYPPPNRIVIKNYPLLYVGHFKAIKTAIKIVGFLGRYLPKTS